MLERLEIGVISSTHGLKGEVKVFPLTDDPLRYRQLKTVLLDLPTGMVEAELEHVAFFKGRPIVKFAGYDSIEAVQKMKGVSLWVRREDAIPLEEGEYFIGDLIGSRLVTEDGSLYGTLEDILRTGANDVYAVKRPDGTTSYLPKIDDVVLSIDAEQQVIVVRPMKEI